MENKKIVFTISFFLILNSCFILSKKTKQITIEKPEFNTDKTLIISKFQVSSDKIEMKILSEYLPDLLYSYLKNIDRIPFSIDIANIKNDTFFKKLGYKPEKIRAKDKRRIINYSLSNDFFSLYLYPLCISDEKQIELPKYFNVYVKKFEEDKTYGKESLFLNGSITNKNIRLSIYDPYTEKNIFEWEKELNIDIEKINIEEININIVKPVTLEIIKSLLEEITKEKYFLLQIEKPEYSIVYIDDKYVDTDSIYVREGKHRIKSTKDGYKPWIKNIEITKDTTIKIEMEKQKEIEVEIDSIPKSAAIFIDDYFVGLTPQKIKVIKDKTYHVRLSLEGFEHYNYKMNLMDENNEKIVLKLKKLQEQEINKTKKTFNTIKNLSFYSFFPVFAAFLYTNERSDYYNNKANIILSMPADQWNKYRLSEIIDRANFFNNTQQVFRNTSILLLITAGIFQLLELEMDDVGVGVDQDKNIGIFYRW